LAASAYAKLGLYVPGSSPTYYTVAKERTILTCQKAWQNTAFFLDRLVSLLPATVAADLSPYRTEVYHLIKQVTHAFIDAFRVKESIA
jgi:hypothetical protein